MKRVLLLVTTLTAGLLTLPPGSVQAVPSDALAWATCPPPLATDHPHLLCATLRVPLDYSNPNGEQLELTVSRARATDPAKRRGVLFVNPGGPGAMATEWAGRLTKPNSAGLTRLPAKVLAAYDVIGLDPRGVGLSTPVSCVDPSYWKGPKPDPETEADRKAWWDVVSTFAQGCGERSGQYLNHFGTADVVRDLDQARIALGEEKISLSMGSYGTYLAAVYGTRYPERVDRMLLDSSVDPTPEQMWYEAEVSQNKPAEARRFDLFEWIAGGDAIFGLGDFPSLVRSQWSKALAKLRQAPRGEVGPHEFITTTFAMTYSESSWNAFGHALADFVLHDDDAALQDLMTPGGDAASENFTAAFHFVSCRDSVWPRDRAVYERDAAESFKTSFSGWSNKWYAAGCAHWPGASETRIVPTGKDLPPILMLNSAGDPATPLAGAKKLHALLPSSILVTAQAGRHGVFANPLSATNQKAQEIGADYLVDGRLPATDITIPGHKLPEPMPKRTQRAEPQMAVPMMD